MQNEKHTKAIETALNITRKHKEMIKNYDTATDEVTNWIQETQPKYENTTIPSSTDAIKQELSKLEQFKDEISSLKDWKGNVDEVSSPTQLKELQKEVSDLKTFKTMSTTVWVVVQIIFGIAATLFGLYLKSS